MLQLDLTSVWKQVAKMQGWQNEFEIDCGESGQRQGPRSCVGMGLAPPESRMMAFECASHFDIKRIDRGERSTSVTPQS